MTVRSASQKRRWISRSCSFLFLNWLALCFRSIITYHGLDTTPDLMAACGRSFPTFFSTTPSYPIVLPFCRFLWERLPPAPLLLSMEYSNDLGLIKTSGYRTCKIGYSRHSANPIGSAHTWLP